MLRGYKKAIWQFLPAPIKDIILIVLTSVRPYNEYDNSSYWRGRASCKGQKSVLWGNEAFNEVYRLEQKKILKPYIEALPSGARVLDIGCGIGVVSKMIHDMRKDLAIDAVDFEEMIIKAQNLVGDVEGINFISSAAENYLTEENYDLIISSGCYSAIRNLDKMYKAIDNGASMLKFGGKILMIDPFHRWKYLARARASSRDIEMFLQPKGLKLVEKSGVIFWLYRLKLANSSIPPELTRKKFYQGEMVLSLLGKHLWADYKILVFKRGDL